MEDTDLHSTNEPFHLVYNGDSAEFMEEFIIRSLGLSCRLTTFEWRMAPMEELQPLLDTVAKCCPNFQNLILVIVSWHTLAHRFPSMTLPKSIRRLGLRSHNQDGKRSLMRQMCDLVSQVSETAQSLRVVRFLDRQTVRNLREVNPKIALQMKTRLDAKNISLEASDGRPLLQ